jgi:ASC-1-like (ASCH) protein
MTACHFENGTQLKTVSVRVNDNEWKYTQEGAEDQFNSNYFYAVVSMPEITEKVFEYGEVKAYAVFDRMDYQYARKHLLPYVLHKEEALNDSVLIYYTETYDVTYGIGWAEFNFRASDFAYEYNEDINPPTMEFDIVITYPQD